MCTVDFLYTSYSNPPFNKVSLKKCLKKSFSLMISFLLLESSCFIENPLTFYFLRQSSNPSQHHSQILPTNECVKKCCGIIAREKIINGFFFSPSTPSSSSLCCFSLRRVDWRIGCIFKSINEFIEIKKQDNTLLLKNIQSTWRHEKHSFSLFWGSYQVLLPRESLFLPSIIWADTVN